MLRAGQAPSKKERLSSFFWLRYHVVLSLLDSFPYHPKSRRLKRGRNHGNFPCCSDHRRADRSEQRSPQHELGAGFAAAPAAAKCARGPTTPQQKHPRQPLLFHRYLKLEMISAFFLPFSYFQRRFPCSEQLQHRQYPQQIRSVYYLFRLNFGHCHAPEPENPKNTELIHLNVLYLNVLGHLNLFNVDLNPFN